MIDSIIVASSPVTYVLEEPYLVELDDKGSGSHFSPFLIVPNATV